MHKYKIFSKWKTDQWIYNLTEYVKFIEVVLDPTLQLTFKKLRLGKFCYSINKNVHNYLKRILKYSSIFQLHISVRSHFLHILQLKQHKYRRLKVHMENQLSSIMLDI